MKENSLIYTGKILGHLAKDFLYFPIWWYSVGLFRFLKRQKIFISHRYQASALGVWAKNIFVPMYGQTDIASRIISFFVRLFQIITRSIIMLFWLILSLLVILLYLTSPILIIYALTWQFT